MFLLQMMGEGSCKKWTDLSILTIISFIDFDVAIVYRNCLSKDNTMYVNYEMADV
jgi:hypothetical protein